MRQKNKYSVKAIVNKEELKKMGKKAPSRTLYLAYHDTYFYNPAYGQYLKENLTTEIIKDIENKIKALDKIDDVKLCIDDLLHIELYKNNNKLVLNYDKKEVSISILRNSRDIDLELDCFFYKHKETIFNIIHNYVE